MFLGKGEMYTYLNSEKIRNYSDICVHMSSLVSKDILPLFYIFGLFT